MVVVAQVIWAVAVESCGTKITSQLHPVTLTQLSLDLGAHLACRDRAQHLTLRQSLQIEVFTPAVLVALVALAMAEAMVETDIPQTTAAAAVLVVMLVLEDRAEYGAGSMVPMDQEEEVAAVVVDKQSQVEAVVLASMVKDQMALEAQAEALPVHLERQVVLGVLNSMAAAVVLERMQQAE